MALSLRPTGLGHGFYKDSMDYNVFCGDLCIDRISENRSGPEMQGLVLTAVTIFIALVLAFGVLPPS